MSILSELNDLITPLAPVETGVFSDKPPSIYVVLTPLIDRLVMFSDNKPYGCISEVRISIYTKDNYLKLKSQLTKMLINADFTITDRRYIGYETDTAYFHYVIDVAKHYETEE